MRKKPIRPLLSIIYILILAGCALPAPAPTQTPVVAYTQTPGLSVTPQPTTHAPIFADGFEGSNLDPWEHGGGATLTTDSVHAGHQAVQIANDNLKTDLTTRAGEIYKITAWIRLASETGTDWGGFRIEADGAQWEVLAQTNPYLQSTAGSQWMKISLSFRAVSSLTHLQVGYFGGPARKLVAELDDLAVFEKGANLSPKIQASFSKISFSQIPAKLSYSLQADDPDGAVVETFWDFGDGTRSFEPSGTHLVTSSGQFQAVLKVVDDDGAVSTQTIAWQASSPEDPAWTVDPLPAVVQTSTLQVQGSAQADGLKMMVSTDRGFAAAIQGGKMWQASVSLSPGLNRILVQATSVKGSITTRERQVRYIPSAPLRVSGLEQSAPSVEQWQVFQLTFDVENSAATDPYLPYDLSVPASLRDQDGISVDGLFSPDHWKTVYSRPGYLSQAYQRENKDNAEWLFPQGPRRWTVRFAPPQTGEPDARWEYKIHVRDAHGEIETPAGTFGVTPPQPDHHGPIRVSSRDHRYFEYADQTVFLGSGMNINFPPEGFSFAASQIFDEIGPGNQNFFRWWIGGALWGSAWQPWNSLTLNYDGYLPATGLSLESAYGDGIASLKLDAANPLMFQGWNTGHAGLVPGEKYRLRVRWRTEGVSGPRQEGQPYGLTVKLTGWPELDKMGSIPALIPPIHGDTPWHVAEADFQADGNYLPNLAVLLENTTQGSAYIDEISLFPLQSDGSLGPQLLRGSQFNSLTSFDDRRAAGIDAILAEANRRGLYFKLVISEKNEFLLNHLAPNGLPDPKGGNFFRGPGSVTHWLHQAYWRYLSARFGAYQSVQSWELVNETAPGPGEPFQLAADLARYSAADGNPHLASISTWATLAEDAWKNPESASIPYTDFHQYIRPQDGLAVEDDTAQAFSTWDQKAAAAGFNKPVIWGELGFSAADDTSKELEGLSKDTQGIWLHKLVWARTGPGGVIPLYWFTDNIFKNHLSPIFGGWNRFMQGLPINNGSYQGAAPETSTPDLWVLGQKDLQDHQAYLWIDNRKHTWKAVVDGQPVPPVSGSIGLDLGSANKSYQIDWYDTDSGDKVRSESNTADSSGRIQITVRDLAGDTALKIFPQN